MSTTEEWMRSLGQELMGTSQKSLWVGVAVLFLSGWLFFSSSTKKSYFPTINEPKSMWTRYRAVSQYRSDAKTLIENGFQKFAGPFTVVTDNGPLLMLPPEYIDAINQEPKLSFNAHVTTDYLANFDTFRTFREPPKGLFEEAVMKGLTRSLPKFTKSLSLEMASCLDDTWTQLPEWHEIQLHDSILPWVARLSTRIFLGERLVGNKDWLRISADFTMNCFIGLTICKLLPGFPLRWLADKLLPHCRRARRDYRAASTILKPILAERYAEIAAAQREGRTPNLPDDAIEWFRNASKGRQYNEVDLQLGLAVAAMHTTSDLVSQSILNLCAHPEVVAPLREEAISVLKQYGWQKVALTELRLLDSFLKETQRMKPINMSSLHRRATADVELPNGVKIAKGEHTAVSSHRMWSAEDYQNPDEFDAFRFVERRKLPGYENRSLLVSTSFDHLGFSHGKHACPGRFFAANEVKIAMVHVIMKYDLKIEDPKMAQWMTFGTAMIANPKAKISVKRRETEVDLELLANQL